MALLFASCEDSSSSSNNLGLLLALQNKGPTFSVTIEKHKIDDIVKNLKDNFDSVYPIEGNGLAVDAGSILSLNMVLLGAAIPMLGIDHDKIMEGVRRIFARKGEAIVAANLAAIEAGYQASNI